MVVKVEGVAIHHCGVFVFGGTDQGVQRAKIEGMKVEGKEEARRCIGAQIDSRKLCCISPPGEASSNKCHASSNKCLTSSNNVCY